MINKHFDFLNILYALYYDINKHVLIILEIFAKWIQ